MDHRRPITFALLATCVVGADRLRRSSRAIDSGPIVEACRRLIESLAITRRVTVAVCERIAAPVLVGIVRPVILLPPAALTGWSPDEIEMVLLHELAHVRRWDNLVNLAQRLVESLLFFHPIVWWVSGWVRREREACCDLVVVGRTNRPHAYAEMLVALAAQMPRSVLFHPTASSAMAAGPLRGRIRRILQLEDDPMLISGKSLTVVLGSLAIVTILSVLYLPARGSAEQSADKAEGFATEGTENTESNADNTSAIESPNANEGGFEDLFGGSSGSETTYGQSDDRIAQSGNEIEASRSANKGGERSIEADDWPDSLGPPPRLNRVLAEKAWQRLGLKLVPMSEEEHEAFEKMNVPAGLKIVGGNVPASLPLPACIVKLRGQTLGEHDTQSFELLRLWLDSEDGQSHTPVKCYAFADGEEFLFEARPPDSTPIQSETTPEVPSSRAHFPSLEEQKLADEAWKALGLELGPISEKDLRRVKALGYDGGLRVANDGSSAAFRRSDVQTGDLLVGLHVWPTTSLKDVAKVLNRDDLAELIPLKFYVVRRAVTQMQPGFGGGEPRSRMAAESHDEVVTGRIGIDSPFLQARRGSATAQAVSTSHDLLQVPQSPEASDQLQGDFQAQRMALSQFQHQVESQIGEAVQRLRADRGRQASGAAIGQVAGRSPGRRARRQETTVGHTNGATPTTNCEPSRRG